MAAPAPSWNTTRVFGTWHNLDGTLKAGKVKVTVPLRVVNVANDVIIPAGSATYELLTASVYHEVASQAAMLALSGAVGDVAIRTDLLTGGNTFRLTATPASTLGNWSPAVSFDQPLPSNNDPDNLPNTGWQLSAKVTFDDASAQETYSFNTPVAGGDIDLRTLTPVGPSVALLTPDPTWIIGGSGGLALYDQTAPVVAHGTDPSVARPAGASVVIWFGTATPANKQPQDIWTDAT